MGNILSNTDISENYDRKIQIEKLTPIGREIIENYKPVRVDSKTIELIKPENFKFSNSEIISQNGKQSKRKK